MNHPASQFKILIVDDTEANRYSMKKTFEHAGYQVLEATDGAEALRLSQGKPDLIVLDVALPDMSGYEVAEILKSKSDTAPIPILQISVDFIQYKNDSDLKNSTADSFLAQPVDSQVLLASARALLRARVAETEFRRLYEKSQKSLAELKEEKLFRERVAIGLTHDLRSSVATGKMVAELLASESSDTINVKDYASMIQRNLDKALSLIDGLLDANRIQAGQSLEFAPEKCEIQSLAKETIGALERAHQSLFIFSGDTSVEGWWDPRAVSRILENLSTNAVKYGAPGKPITIKILKIDSCAHIYVHNHGDPISLHDQRLIFEIFERSLTAQKSGKFGLGIGLSIVKGLSEAHGGSVSVESASGAGTTFKVILPQLLNTNLGS